MPADPRSPYELELGAAMSALHPSLQRYFATIPPGFRGIGEGVFEEVGTPRRWLWPLIRLVEGRGVVVATWEHDVPFRVENRTVGGRAVAVRELHLARGTWVMRDAVGRASGGGVVDRLGSPALVSATFDVAVDGEALVLRSRSVGIVLGRRLLPLPRPLAPRVSLRESHDDGRQRVAVTVDAPLLGRVYGYSGTFSYRIERDQS